MVFSQVKNRRKVVHLTSVHSSTDVRIRQKECAALAVAGLDVVLVACATRSEDCADGVRLRAIPPPRGRLSRMTLTSWRAYRIAMEENADLYHVHDPELLPWALLLIMHGKRVVYDAHEDVVGTVAYKGYIPRWLRSFVSVSLGALEKAVARRCDAIVAATPHIGELVRRLGPPVVVVQNFPRLEELAPSEEARPYCERGMNAAYIGGISRVRGISEMLQAIGGLSEYPDAVLQVAGSWQPPVLRDELMRVPVSGRVVDHGYLNRVEVVKVLGSCRVGLVTFWPEQNHVMAYPTKMFEYMAVGLPVIASDFPLWRQIVEKSGCGLLVDPTNVAAIRDALRWLFSHPVEAKAMGERGRAAIAVRYCWEKEAKKLIALYESLLEVV